jgi:hypothetical protein
MVLVENSNISENKIITVEAAKVLWFYYFALMRKEISFKLYLS